MQPQAHFFLQQGKLVLPGTAAGVVHCRKTEQAAGGFFQHLPAMFLHQVKAADENIRAEILGDVSNAPVGAAAEENGFFSFF